jgi:polyphosphate kinase 2 (PPK2 family)
VIVPQTRDVVGSAGASEDARATGGPTPRISDLLRAPAGAVDLETMSTSATPGFAGAGKAEAQAELVSLSDEAALLQKQLFAQGRAGGSRRLLLVLQGMDTSGKGAVVEHVLGTANPMGVQYHAFTRPTIEEREHHFLWRVVRRLPPPGIIGVFDRSHDEDVLVVRVHQLVPTEQWATGYDVIDWHDYQLAYAGVLRRGNAMAAPWYVVPADRRWCRNWAVSRILVEQLRTMGLAWPAPSGWDPETERARRRELAA